MSQSPLTCPECHTVLLDCPGIGPYCQNINCKRIDNLTDPYVAPPLIQTQAPLMTISHRSDPGPLATLYRDGTVELANPEAASEAAKVFWGAISLEGRTLNQRVEEGRALLSRVFELGDEIGQYLKRSR